MFIYLDTLTPASVPCGSAAVSPAHRFRARPFLLADGGLEFQGLGDVEDLRGPLGALAGCTRTAGGARLEARAGSDGSDRLALGVREVS